MNILILKKEILKLSWAFWKLFFIEKCYWQRKTSTTTLCFNIGYVHYNSLSSYLGPEKPVNKLSYNDPLVKPFKQKMHMPMKSVEVTQHYFLNIYQKENQSVSEFVADP